MQDQHAASYLAASADPAAMRRPKRAAEEPVLPRSSVRYDRDQETAQKKSRRTRKAWSQFKTITESRVLNVTVCDRKD